MEHVNQDSGCPGRDSYCVTAPANATALKTRHLLSTAYVSALLLNGGHVHLQLRDGAAHGFRNAAFTYCTA
jgi:hypothetical protein